MRRIDGWSFIGAPSGPRLLVAAGDPGGAAVLARLDALTGAVTAFGRDEHWSAPPRCTSAATAAPPD
ncbi:hypothetical protein [Dactylosporangium sp. CA-233914]|uniref:hypothetical protein n=1 Tax=Dactylosporangium sp. CA-233914 TaxID=3239934 RepID=UPI003D8CD6C4